MSEDPAQVNYKTVRLARGRHTSPTLGVCVMELASMIAGEPFSDQPRSVCPSIAAFLRAYNDAIDDRRRQDLYRYASMAVGTRESRFVERQRIERCLTWAREMRRSRRWPARALRRVTILPAAPPDAGRAAAIAVEAIGRPSDATHERALALVEELCAITSRPLVEHVVPSTTTNSRREHPAVS